MADRTICLLLVEDNPGDAALLRQALVEATPLARFDMRHVSSLSEAHDELVVNPCDLMLLDLSLPDSQGLDTLRTAIAMAPDAAIVVLTGMDSDEVALEAVRNGAQDYIVKGRMDSDLLGRALQYALERKRLVKEQQRLIGELREALSTVKKLSGLLPICSSCKKIRDDRGYWTAVEEYIHQRSEADFTHGICPDCMHRLYGDVFGEDQPPDEQDKIE